MLNELLFISHIVITMLFALGALALGKEALVATICFFIALANLFVLKQTVLFGLTVTCSDVFIVGAVLGMNLLQEYHGKEIVARTIWINFYLSVIYVVMGLLHVAYVAAVGDVMQGHYASILSNSPRIIIASMVVCLLVQYLDRALYDFLQKKYGQRYLVMRNIFSTAATQLVDTLLFSFLGLYGLVDSIGDIIIMSLAVKVVIITIAGPCVKLSHLIFRRG